MFVALFKMMRFLVLVEVAKVEVDFRDVFLLGDESSDEVEDADFGNYYDEVFGDVVGIV